MIKEEDKAASNPGLPNCRVKLTSITISLALLAALFFGTVLPCAAVTFTPATLLFEIDRDIKMPSDIAVSASGRIYVVDGVNHAVRVYSSKGKHLFSFGSKGSGDGQLNYPLGIDIDSSGKVYIADSGNHRVQVFSAEGGFIAKISIPSDKTHPADPTDVAVDESRNRCYVVDNDNHRIVVLNLSDFSIGRSYGSPGNEKLNFRYPFQMALDKDNYLFIVDVINTRVQVLNPEGRFVAYIGGWGVDVGEFFRPKGIALSHDGRVFVSDSYTGVIQIFNTDGKFLSAVGRSDKSSVKTFRTPAGLHVDRHNRLYVVEMLADKVGVYKLGRGRP